MALAVLAITLVAVVVFFPVTFLFGVSKYLFTALALGVVIALFASYFVAVTVVPLFCAHFLKAVSTTTLNRRWSAKIILGRQISRLVQREIRPDAEFYERWVRKALDHPRQDLVRFRWLLPA